VGVMRRRLSAAREAAFVELGSSMRPGLQRLAYSITLDTALAEDIVQETLLQCFVNWERVEKAEQPRAYVRKICHRTAWRAMRRQSLILPSAQPESLQDDSSEDRIVLQLALKRLPPKQRAVLVLRFLEDLSVRDTAYIMSCDSGTVKSQTSKALGKLRDFFPQEGANI
jgi:RNA polymerase sigma-70 factor (sigma-E family)